MKVLVTNDDGIDAPGLHALARALVADGHDVVVVAPARDMSGSGAAIGQVHLDQSIDARRVELPGLDGVPAYALDGAPGPVRARRPPRRLRRPARRGRVRHQPRLQHRAGRAPLGHGRRGADRRQLRRARAGGQHRRRVHPRPRAGRGRCRRRRGRVDGRGRRRRRPGATATEGAGATRRRAPACRATGTPPARPRPRAVDWLLAAPDGTVLNVNVPDRPPDELAGRPRGHAGAVRHRPHVGRRVGRDARPPAARDAAHPGRPAARLRHRPRRRRLRRGVGHHRRPPRRPGRR